MKVSANMRTLNGHEAKPRTRVLVVGNTPPPHLGLPIMLEALVRSEMEGIEIRHLRIEVSRNESQVGKFRLGKVLRVFPIIVRIVSAWMTFRPQILYYAPAAASRISMLRDIAILGCTRILFPQTVLHFHAGGHGELYQRLPWWLRWPFRWAFFHPDGAIRLSPMTPDDARGLKAKRDYIVPNGIPDPGVRSPIPLPESLDELAPLSAGGRPLRVLFVALLCETKGLLVLIDACGRLARRGVPFQLDVMGRFESDEFAARVKKRIAELQIEHQVQFVGVQSGDQKWATFHRADVLCHPTFLDTFGLVLVEAMACGLPVVATRYCSIPLIVDDGETGMLVEPHDPEAVADCLAELAEDPQLREQMGRAGREKFLREFTLSTHIERMRRVFLDVAGELPLDSPQDIPVEFPAEPRPALAQPAGVDTPARI